MINTKVTHCQKSGKKLKAYLYGVFIRMWEGLNGDNLIPHTPSPAGEGESSKELKLKKMISPSPPGESLPRPKRRGI